MCVGFIDVLAILPLVFIHDNSQFHPHFISLQKVVILAAFLDLLDGLLDILLALQQLYRRLVVGCLAFSEGCSLTFQLA